ncbi:alpha/beta fold hydrolase [Aquincola sp. S2]|uniref:Alpha/beta fold hydrolase n=1 Tax=Pseudaquabacterium terrae TaxID=2732868 RepID=A0ABX2EFV7_9BURK|nr:alpha/beta fold hydrolase [Aquabacterium terrae]NRF67493.1 alpha/beta fold hydrolase [Aquabacterium terrae]
MKMRAQLTLFRGLLIGGLVSIGSSAADPYGLISDEDFATRFGEVEAFWSKSVLPSAGKLETEDQPAIHYVKAVQGRPGPVVVISSGRTEHYGKYKELIHDLWRQGYSVYIHDHRGQGVSGPPDLRPRGHVENFDQYVDDLNRFLEKVVKKEQTERTKLFLLGHSMGGGIGIRFLEKYPGTVNAAAFSSPMLAPNTGMLPVGLICPFMRATAWLRSEQYVLGEGPPSNPPTAYDSPENIFTTSPARFKALLVDGVGEHRLGGPTRKWLAEACRASSAMLADAGAITEPVMIVRSPTDEAVLPEAQDKFCEVLKQARNPCHGDDAEPQKPISLRGAKHELFIEHDKYRTVALKHVLDFFARQ